jgi:hypothetical protein
MRVIGATENRLSSIFHFLSSVQSLNKKPRFSDSGSFQLELDDILRERTATLKSQRERTKAALDRAQAKCGTVTTINPDKIDALPAEDRWEER